MSQHNSASTRPVSRRDFLSIAAVSGGTLMAVALNDSAPAAAPKKLSQQKAHYQPIPKSGQRCQTCSLWQPPTACQQVEGQISPAGWCILYSPKS
jgi:anaerobic selenocysteine-containing dehydrogenase